MVLPLVLLANLPLELKVPNGNQRTLNLEQVDTVVKPMPFEPRGPRFVIVRFVVALNISLFVGKLQTDYSNHLGS